MDTVIIDYVAENRVAWERLKSIWTRGRMETDPMPLVIEMKEKKPDMSLKKDVRKRLRRKIKNKCMITKSNMDLRKKAAKVRWIQ